MRFVFDIDNTICDVEGKDYHNAKPRPKMIALINQLHDAGHWIGFHTARGMGTLNGDVGKVYETWYDVTFKQLTDWGLKFDELRMGKPYCDLYVDDRAFGVNGEIDVEALSKHLVKTGALK
jgi:capsule biosynthesis phosphatase